METGRTRDELFARLDRCFASSETAIEPFVSWLGRINEHHRQVEHFSATLPADDTLIRTVAQRFAKGQPPLSDQQSEIDVCTAGIWHFGDYSDPRIEDAVFRMAFKMFYLYERTNLLENDISIPLFNRSLERITAKQWSEDQVRVVIDVSLAIFDQAVQEGQDADFPWRGPVVLIPCLCPGGWIPDQTLRELASWDAKESMWTRAESLLPLLNSNVDADAEELELLLPVGGPLAKDVVRVLQAEGVGAVYRRLELGEATA